MKKALIVLLTILALPLSLFTCKANAVTRDATSNYLLENKAVTLTSVTAASATSISLNWTDESYCLEDEGYKIYRANSKKGKYSIIKEINDRYATSYTDKGLTTGKKYYYKVCKYDNLNENSEFSNIESATATPSKMFFTAVFTKKNKIKLKWDTAEKGVDGYVIYRASSKNGTYSKIKKIKGRTNVSYTDTDVTYGKFYYYKMKAYSEVKDKTVYGEVSDAVRNKVDISLCRPYFTKTGRISSNSDKFYKSLRLNYGNKVLTEDDDYYIGSSCWGSNDNGLSYLQFTASGCGEDFTGEFDFGVEPISSKTQIKNVGVTNSGIKVTWEKEAGALGYKIYRKIGSGSYSAVKTISDNSIVSWTDEEADKINIKYKYFVRAYTKNKNEHVYADKSDAISVKRISTPKLKSVANKKEGIVLKWRSVKGAKSYDVLRKTENGEWKYIANTPDTQYTDKKTKTGSVYTYTVCCSNGKKQNRVSYYNSKGIKAERLVVVEGKSQSSSSVTITWNKATTTDGYVIYRATSPKGTYKKIKTIKGERKLSFTDKNLTFAKYYYYKVRPYYINNGKTVYGNYGKIAKVRPTTGIASIKKAKAITPTKVKLTWGKVTKADGYKIYQASSKNGTYKRVKTVSGNGITSYTVTKLKNANRYYFKIKCYRKVKGKIYYGDYSTVKSCYIDMLGYAGEGYYSKSKRIWGKEYYQQYTSQKAAERDMKTIIIKTWDINSNGKKYTRYHYLTVHKKIAPTVEQIFKEIYKGKEKFPIKSVGGYSWRTERSEHREGLAIDINPNENAQFNGATGKPMVGSFWKPGKNPYSISPKGDVVRIFAKYGFGWGEYFSNPDYMHLSYFGT